MARVAVTGPAGFVGANLVRRLVHDGHDVHLLVHPESDLWRLEGLEPHTSLHRVDLDDAEAVTPLMRRTRPEWVLHLAAHGAYPYQTDLRRMIATNLVGTVNLVEAALDVGVEAFVHTGSSSEYGTKDHAPAEDELPEPNSYYAVTKASATLYCRHMARTHGAGIRALRLYSVYGPWEEPTRLMPRLLTCALRGGWPPMTNPSTARDYVYVDDVVDAYIAAATEGGQDPGAVYNVGTGIQTTLGQLVAMVRHTLSVDVDPVWGSMADRLWDTGVWVAQPAVALKRLGWSAHHDMASGLTAFVAWLRGHPEVLARYEVVDA